MKKIIICFFGLSLLCSCSLTLHGAVRSNNLEAVEKNVTKGDINKKIEPYGHTPLFVACYYGYSDIARYLCEHGADVDAQANDGTTPLICTAQYNYPEITEILIDSSAKVNLQDRKGHTALYYAKENRYTKVADLLEAAGAISK